MDLTNRIWTAGFGLPVAALGTPKWVALVSGNMDQNLRSISWWFNFDPHPNATVAQGGAPSLFKCPLFFFGVGDTLVSWGCSTPFSLSLSLPHHRHLFLWFSRETKRKTRHCGVPKKRGGKSATLSNRVKHLRRGAAFRLV